jgi:predicted transposase/invertase (TIGR01784 family)
MNDPKEPLPPGDGVADNPSEPPRDDAEQRAQRAPHDELFKGIFRSKDEATSLLRSSLPAKVSQCIDWSTLAEVPTEQVDGGLSKRYNDLLFRAQLIGAAREAYIEVALEHQSSSERMMALRMLGLVVRRTELIQTTLKAFRRYIPDFEFALDDLTQQSWDALAERQLTAAAWVALTVLRDASRNPHFLQELRNSKHLEQWRALSTSRYGAMVLEQLWVYLYRVVDAPMDQLHEFASTVGELAGETQMNVAQRLIEAGRAEGKLEGRAEGKAATLKRQAQLKFGALSDAVVLRIDGASSQDLERWTERILFAQSLSELFEP